MKRRGFIKIGASASLYMYANPSAFAKSLPRKPRPPFEINLEASKSHYPLRPGNSTEMLTFKGESLGSLSPLSKGSGFLGPTIEVNKGQGLKINFRNRLNEESIVHWHGLHLPENQDGHPSFAVGPGETYNYQFQVTNRAGLYWYHPHPHGRTGFQVYSGLAGLFVVRDEEEKALNLPSGENELFLVLQDRHLDENNQLIYVQSGHDIMMGKVGDQLVVNGSLDRSQKVRQEAYRLRLLNGGNAYPYRLQWSDGSPLHLIGTDGGLLEKREELENILFTPGERLDILVDFSNKKMGEEIELLSVPLVENENSKAFSLYKFKVSGSGSTQFKMPEKLSHYERINPEEASNFNNPKVFRLEPKAGVGWTIDGLPYEMNEVRPKERIPLGSTEIWEFDLTNSGMIHPMHIHGSPFQVLERIHGPLSQGLVFDKGWKDTVAVLPGDRVRVIKRFDDFSGQFLFHCHILEHEDHSMMRNFVVE